MSSWQIALVREQGVEFAVAVVQDSVLAMQSKAANVTSALEHQLGRPVVLLGARQHRLYGRSDIVRFLRNVHPSRLPWRRMTLAA